MEGRVHHRLLFVVGHELEILRCSIELAVPVEESEEWVDRNMEGGAVERNCERAVLGLSV